MWHQNSVDLGQGSVEVRYCGASTVWSRGSEEPVRCGVGSVESGKVELGQRGVREGGAGAAWSQDGEIRAVWSQSVELEQC